MFHYTRPSFNTAPPITDGYMAGNFRHVLDPDDARLATGGAKEKTKNAGQPKAKPKLILTEKPKKKEKKKRKK